MTSSTGNWLTNDTGIHEDASKEIESVKGHGTMLAAKLAISDEDRAMLARANRVLHKEQPQPHPQQRRDSYEEDETSPNLLSCFGVRSKKSGSGNSSFASHNGSGNVYVERETRVRFDSKPDIRRAQTSPWTSTPTLNRSVESVKSATG